MLQQDRKLYPAKSKRDDGSLLWDSHQAKLLLRKDVEAMKHKGMKPSTLRKTNDDYNKFSLSEFRQHIYQENRRRRFCNHLNDRREKSKIIHHVKKPVDGNDNTMVERLQALGLNQADTLENVPLGANVMKGMNSRKRTVEESCLPNKKRRIE